MHSSITDGGALPEEYAGLVNPAPSENNTDARSAIPAIPTTGTIDYVVTATTVGSTPSKTATGSVASGMVSIPLTTGYRWSVTVTMRHTVSSVTTEILSDTYTMPEGTTLSASSPLLEHDFTLEPIESDGTGGGSISLSMSGGTGSTPVFEAVTIASVKKNGVDVTNDWSGGNWSGTNSKLNVQNSQISTKSGQVIAPGVYNVTLHFTKDNQLVYYTMQTITVFKNMTTSKWVSSGGTSSPINGSGTFEVTTALVNACIQDVFYVGSPASGITASDTDGTGNPYKPFATVKKAVDTINDLPERTAQNPYIIRVKNNTSNDVSETISIQNNISIECYDSSFDDNAGKATLTRIANVSFFSIENSYALTIDGKSLSPEGTPLSDTEWSGLVLDGNKDAEKTGSGIRVYNGGKLTLNGGTIKNCSSSSGAGVYNNGQFIMNRGIISDNIASSSGGGVYDDHYSETNVDETFVMNGGIIIRNSAEQGGGVCTKYSNARFTMNDGAITNNTSTGTTNWYGGGGVYIDTGGRFLMVGGSISENTADLCGGGVYIYGGSSTPSEDTIGFTMSGGTIAGNEAADGGGGVYLKCARMCMYGSAVIGDDSSEITSAATSSYHSNIAKVGGGINAYYSGAVYIGYSNANTPASSTGGIYYNYATGIAVDNSNNTIHDGGGGVYGATKIANYKIKYNGAAGKGGGVYAYYGCTIENTEISGNSAVDGGGIFDTNSGVVLSSGVVVSGNTATGNGSGVYVNCVQLGINGSAYVKSSGTDANDVYLADGYIGVQYKSAGVIIKGALEPPDAAGGKVATISPASYPASGNTSGQRVYLVDSPNPETTLPAEVGKFAVTSNAGKDYVVNSDGKIAEDTGFVLVNGATVGAVSGSKVFVSGRTIAIPSMYVCKHQVTQAEYQAIMGSNPSKYSSDPADGEVQEKRPVEQVSWYEALVYCNKRSAAENLNSCYSIDGSTNPANWGDPPTSDNSTWDAVSCDWSANGYRLPTEAEWEYIARGGNNGIPATQTDFSGSNTADFVAWYTSNSGNEKTHQVMLKTPNTLGIYDLSGNVHEWCWDKWTGNISSSTPAYGPTSFLNESEGSTHVKRGGFYGTSESSLTVSNSRDYFRARVKSDSCGLRVVRTANTTPGS